MRNLRDMQKKMPCKRAALFIGALAGELGRDSFIGTF